MTKYIFTLLATLLFSYNSAAYPGLEEVVNFGSNPGNLAFYQFVPEKLKKDSIKRPLVVVLHGCNQSAGAIARTSDWNKLAKKHNFYIAYPEQRMINNPSRCYNWFRSKDISEKGGEVESIHQIVQYMQRNYGVDSSMIFIYGVSAGAAISVAYMANHPEVINSGAILAGSAYGMARNVFDGMRVMLNAKELSGMEWKRRLKEARPDYDGPYPRLIAMHGLKDPVVEPEHSRQLVKQWLAIYDLDSEPSIIHNYQTNPGLTRWSYLKDSAEVIIHYEMEGLGHALSVNPGNKNEYFGGRSGIFSKDNGFFSTYWIAKDFGLITKSKAE